MQPRLLVLLFALAFLAPASLAGAPTCATEPGAAGAAARCDADGDGHPDATTTATCAPGSACSFGTHGEAPPPPAIPGDPVPDIDVAGFPPQPLVDVGGGADPAARNGTIHGQASQSPMPGGMEDRIQFGDGAAGPRLAMDGSAPIGVGGTPAPVALNTTPHWTVDTMGPQAALAFNHTILLGGDVDGDGSALVATDPSCSVGSFTTIGCPTVVDGVTFGRDKDKLRARADGGGEGADVDGGAAGLSVNHTKHIGQPQYGDITVRDWDPKTKHGVGVASRSDDASPVPSELSANHTIAADLDGDGAAERVSNATFTIDLTGPSLLASADAGKNGSGVAIKPIRCELQRGCSEDHGVSAGPAAFFGHSEGAIHGERIITPVGNGDTHTFCDAATATCGGSAFILAGGSVKGCALQTKEPTKLEVPDIKCVS